MSACSREAALFYSYRSVLMYTGTGLFRGKMAKNRLVCKNAVALAYYGSCWLLVMGSCYRLKRFKDFVEKIIGRTCRGLFDHDTFVGKKALCD